MLISTTELNKRVEELKLMLDPPDDADSNLQSIVESFSRELLEKECHLFQSKGGCNLLLNLMPFQEKRKTLFFFFIRPPRDSKSLRDMLVGSLLFWV
jgi:hypothetical protein